MKKVLFIAVLGLIAFSSCKKKECECITTFDGAVVQTMTYENNNCSSLELTNASGTVTCKEK